MKASHLTAIVFSWALTTASALPAAAADITTSYGPIAVRSDGRGQLSSAIYTVAVQTGQTLQVNYQAPATHCASLKMHFLLDGAEKAVTDVIAPGQQTGYVDLGPVTPGEHQVGLRAEGVIGGCNVGYVTAWEGSATIRTNAVAPDPSAAIDAIDAGCGGGVVARGWGVHVSSDGTVKRNAYGVGRQTRSTTEYHVPVEQVQALFSRAQAAGLMALQLNEGAGEAYCVLSLSAGSARHDLVMSPGSGPKNVREIFNAAVSMAPVDAQISR